MKLTTARSFFLHSTAVVLAIVALAKFVSAFGTVAVLKVYDPFLAYFTIRQLVLIAASLEIFVAGLIWILPAKRQALKISAVMWLALLLLFYRLGHYFGDFIEPCHCLGTVPSAIGLNPDFADFSLKLFLAYMLVGTLTLLMVGYFEKSFFKTQGP